MKDRLLEFLRHENKSSAQLADEIGVQASGISHILSGRNNPSLDFILKMLGKYPFISTDWLLFGKGTMYKEQKMQSLFDEIPLQREFQDENQIKIDIFENSQKIQKEPSTDNLTGHIRAKETSPDSSTSKDIIKIIWFYKDSTFEEFSPR